LKDLKKMLLLQVTRAVNWTGSIVPEFVLFRSPARQNTTRLIVKIGYPDVGNNCRSREYILASDCSISVGGPRQYSKSAGGGSQTLVALGLQSFWSGLLDASPPIYPHNTSPHRDTRTGSNSRMVYVYHENVGIISTTTYTRKYRVPYQPIVGAFHFKVKFRLHLLKRHWIHSTQMPVRAVKSILKVLNGSIYRPVTISFESEGPRLKRSDSWRFICWSSR